MLGHCVDADSMNGLTGVLCRFATIWTCMDVMPSIVKSLDDAHYAWKLRGVPSRPLLTLLMKFDNDRYLSKDSRERLSADISVFSLVNLALIKSLGCSISRNRPSNLMHTPLSLFLIVCPRLDS